MQENAILKYMVTPPYFIWLFNLDPENRPDKNRSSEDAIHEMG
jgi:hypothetical protein